MKEIVNNYFMGLIDSDEMFNQLVSEITKTYCSLGLPYCPISLIKEVFEQNHDLMEVKDILLEKLEGLSYTHVM